MALKTNAVLVFVGYDIIPAPLYTPPAGVDAGQSLLCRFTCADPGPNQGALYQCVLTSTDIATIQAAVGGAAKAAAFWAACTSRLQQAYRPTSAVTAALDGLLNQTVTV
jgi:hypothetical protein